MGRILHFDRAFSYMLPMAFCRNGMGTNRCQLLYAGVEQVLAFFEGTYFIS